MIFNMKTIALVCVPALLENMSKDRFLPTHVSDSILVEMDRREVATVKGNKFPSGGFPSPLPGFLGHCLFGQRGIMFIILAIFALWWCKYSFKVPGGVLEDFRLCKVGKTSTVRGNEPRPLSRSVGANQPLSHSPRGGGCRLWIFHPKTSTTFLDRIWGPNSAWPGGSG